MNNEYKNINKNKSNNKIKSKDNNNKNNNWVIYNKNKSDNSNKNSNYNNQNKKVKYEEINISYRKVRERMADERIRNARNTAESEIEVVIDEGSVKRRRIGCMCGWCCWTTV